MAMQSIQNLAAPTNQEAGCVRGDITEKKRVAAQAMRVFQTAQQVADEKEAVKVPHD